ncbi:MAG: hypothetical protein JST69_11550 [Bacteroidetes bacterium]|nr:hypothetical protein [Bacteroidota bacterium]
MNKLLKGTIALLLFALAIGVFEMCSKENVIAQAASYVLPIATPSVLGGVKPDGTTILVDATGKISTAGTPSLPVATTTTLGGVKPDGTTITVDANGKISSTVSQQQNKIIFSAMSGTGGALYQVWIANSDGTNQVQVPLTNLPSNLEFLVPAKISPNGQTIFLVGHVPGSSPSDYQIYSMSTTGTNVTKLIELTGPGGINDIVINDIQAY